MERRPEGTCIARQNTLYCIWKGIRCHVCKKGTSKWIPFTTTRENVFERPIRQTHTYQVFEGEEGWELIVRMTDVRKIPRRDRTA